MEKVCCNSCGGNACDVLFSKWTFNIVRCRECGLCYVNPRNFTTEADEYFRGAYLSTIEENGVTKPGILHIYREILERLSAYLITGKLLDVGCAMGHFMREARQHGWDVCGTECSEYAAAYGRREHGLQIHAVCDLREANLPESHFDATVLIEVAEHLPDPRATFAEIFRVTKPSGVIYVTTPNFTSIRALLRRENWDAVIPTGHLYYFTAESIQSMLMSVGFTDEKNLTPPADFSAELQEARKTGTLMLTTQQTEQLSLSIAQQDNGTISNGRGEGLVVWAVKPRDSTTLGAALLRNRNTRDLEGKLVSSCGATAEEQKVFYVHHGAKHWVTSIDWLDRHGMRLADAIQVKCQDLNSLMLGPPLI